MKSLQFLLLFVLFSVVFSEAIARKAEKDHYKKPHYRTAKKLDYHHHKLPKHLHRDRIGHHGNHDEMHSSHRLESEEGKKHSKAAFHHAPFFVSHQEARLQGDLSATKKSAAREHHFDDSHDMHLQDLTFQTPEHRSPHHFQRGHHRVSHHPFSSHRDDRTKPQHHREGHHKMIFSFQEESKPRTHEVHHSVPISSLHETLSKSRHHPPARKADHGRPLSKKAYDKGKKSKKDSKKHPKSKQHYDW